MALLALGALVISLISLVFAVASFFARAYEFSYIQGRRVSVRIGTGYWPDGKMDDQEVVTIEVVNDSTFAINVSTWWLSGKKESLYPEKQILFGGSLEGQRIEPRDNRIVFLDREQVEEKFGGHQVQMVIHPATGPDIRSNRLGLYGSTKLPWSYRLKRRFRQTMEAIGAAVADAGP